MTPDKKIRMADKADYEKVVSENPDIVEAGAGGPILIMTVCPRISLHRMTDLQNVIREPAWVSRKTARQYG